MVAEDQGLEAAAERRGSTSPASAPKTRANCRIRQGRRSIVSPGRLRPGVIRLVPEQADELARVLGDVVAELLAPEPCENLVGVGVRGPPRRRRGAAGARGRSWRGRRPGPGARAARRGRGTRRAGRRAASPHRRLPRGWCRCRASCRRRSRYRDETVERRGVVDGPGGDDQRRARGRSPVRAGRRRRALARPPDQREQGEQGQQDDELGAAPASGRPRAVPAATAPAPVQVVAGAQEGEQRRRSAGWRRAARSSAAPRTRSSRAARRGSAPRRARRPPRPARGPSRSRRPSRKAKRDGERADQRQQDPRQRLVLAAQGCRRRRRGGAGPGSRSMAGWGGVGGSAGSKPYAPSSLRFSASWA